MENLVGQRPSNRIIRSVELMAIAERLVAEFTEAFGKLAKFIVEG